MTLHLQIAHKLTWDTHTLILYLGQAYTNTLKSKLGQFQKHERSRGMPIQYRSNAESKHNAPRLIERYSEQART